MTGFHELLPVLFDRKCGYKRIAALEISIVHILIITRPVIQEGYIHQAGKQSAGNR